MTAATELYDDILADVLSLTNRADLESESELALRSATLSAHAIGAFPRDAVVASVPIPNGAYIASLDAQVLFPRLRGLSSVQIMDSSLNILQDPEIEIVELGDIRDPIYKTLRNNVAYLAGSSVSVRTAILSYGYLVEYLQMPQVRRDAYNSWIAMLCPDIIIYRAASIVLATNGNMDKSEKYGKMCDTTLKMDLVSNYLTAAIR